MALISPQQAKPSGVVLALAAANAGGDTLKASRDHVLEVRNGGAGAITVTVVVPGVDAYGIARPDIAVSVAAGATGIIGPFPPDLEDPTTGLVAITYSGVTTVTVALIQV